MRWIYLYYACTTKILIDLEIISTQSSYFTQTDLSKEIEDTIFNKQIVNFIVKDVKLFFLLLYNYQGNVKVKTILK